MNVPHYRTIGDFIKAMLVACGYKKPAVDRAIKAMQGGSLLVNPGNLRHPTFIESGKSATGFEHDLAFTIDWNQEYEKVVPLIAFSLFWWAAVESSMFEEAERESNMKSQASMGGN